MNLIDLKATTNLLRSDLMVCAALPLTMLAAREKSDRLCLIIEYDARTVNLGLVASVWRNHFEAMFELQNFRWINFGLRY